MTDAGWQLQLLGEPALAGAGRRVGLSARDAALLAVVRLDGPQPAATLARLGWPALAEAKALNNLRQRLYRWRRDTGAQLLEAGTRLAAADDLAPHRWPALQRPADADQAWLGGDLLDGLPELAERLAPHAAAWQEHAGRSLGERAQAAEEAGDLDEALAWALPLAARNPLDEPAQRRLLRLHFRRGDRAAAMAVYDALREALGEALGLRPSPETTAWVDAMARAHAEPPAPSRELPPALLRPPVTVGRGSALAALRQGLDAGKAMVVQGEAGIGKSRLLSDLLAQRPGLLGTQARPTDAGIALSTLARALRELLRRHPTAVAAEDCAQLARVLPELGPAAPTTGEAQRLLLLRGLERSLARARDDGLTGLALDDLHYADLASALTLLALVTSDALAGFQWLFARRPDSGAGGDRLCQALFETGQADALPLEPLDDAAMHHFVQSLELARPPHPGLAPALRAHTGGNPLFALETLRHLHAQDGLAALPKSLPTPPTVSQLIDLRTRALSPGALDLARLLAVADSAFSVELAEQVLGVPGLRLADAWRELEQAQILRGQGVAHDLVAEVLHHGVPEPIAARLHEQVARHLERDRPPDARSARHWQRAGRHAEALRAHRAAAAEANQLGQYEAEIEQLQAAAECARRCGDGAARFAVAQALVTAIGHVRGPDAAQAQAAELPTLATTPTETIEAWLQQCEICIDRHRLPEAIALGRHALARLRDLGDNRLRFKLLTVMAQAWTLTGRAGRARACLRRAQALLGPDATADDLARHEGARSLVGFHLGNLAMGLQASVALCRLARERHHLTDLHRGLSNLAIITLQTGDATQALGHAREAAALSHRLGLGALQRSVDQFNLGLTAIASARYGDALHSLEAGLALPGAPAAWCEHMRTHLGVAWIHLGQYARARRSLPDLSPDIGPVAMVQAARAAARAELDRLEGRPAAPQTLRHALGLVGGPAGGAVVYALLRLRDAQSRGPEAVLEETATQEGADSPRVVGLARQVARAVALATLRRFDEARAQALEAAPGVHEQAFGFLYKPDLMADLLGVLQGAGDEAAANQLRRQALDWINAVARDHVPEPLREAYLMRHPVHRRLAG